MPLLDAATVVLRGGLPGQPAAPRSAIDVILGTPPSDLGRLSPQDRAACVAALAWCLVQSGQASAAAELADRDGMPLLRRVAATAPADTQSACYAALAEAYLSIGRCRDSTDCARIALDYATESDDDAHRVRTLGLLAASLALNGEFAQADALRDRAEELGQAHDWPGMWPVVLAAVLIDSRRTDAEGLEATLASLRSGDSDGVVERVVLRIGLSSLHAVREEYGEMLTATERVTHGADRRNCPPFLLDQATALQCLALVQLGDPAGALRAVADRQSPPEHSVCFELLRAGIHLQLEEPRKALQVTEACVGNCPDHNVGTLPSVHLRRAVAHELLGQHDSADVEYSLSAHLAAGVGAVGPAFGLPLDVLEGLYFRLMRNEPEFGRLIAARIPADGSYSDPRPLSFVPPQLTEREAVLAGWLATDLTLARIADRLKVSINTVKTQTRTLYRKLEVSGRAEAVDSLEQAGFFVSPPG
ncbi:helix-turn-helix transcriptional regulator [Raineyella sp. W15-4]|uniref:helix-turn-helix transcriptional regulator n=1 Tax=Raineyella sp. W15-4 TaxID=3081651 RepID=UPI002952DC2C|nr:LuxR C-terminal-related transcriptional regulator [Raineyella sp. W15-4]WOQ16875.1 LuxR C-terminal-related transcriptional regulator [Raineyella sp. W15-4]